MGAATYEFSEMENATLASTARFARYWGIISIVAGVLLFIIGLLMVILLGAAVATAPASSSGSAALSPAMVVGIGLSLIPSSIVSIIGGIFYFVSGNNLTKVATTQGEDIPLLMKAVQSLTRAFMIEAIALVVSFIFGFVLSFAMNMNNGGH
jgi:heme/copper-type cytochrome/quinol oxidase subunit 2